MSSTPPPPTGEAGASSHTKGTARGNNHGETAAGQREAPMGARSGGVPAGDVYSDWAGVLGGLSRIVSVYGEVAERERTCGAVREAGAGLADALLGVLAAPPAEGAPGATSTATAAAAAAAQVRPELDVKRVRGAADMSRNIGKARARAVPASRTGRIFHFGQLAVGLATSVLRQRVVGGGAAPREEGKGAGPPLFSTVMTTDNAARLAESLSRMRGAALKLGQMLSIQDENLIPPEVQAVLERVRDGADMMPPRQLHQVLRGELGADWRTRFASFDEQPLAAASIGQVHRARLPDGRAVAVKVQYPGVAESIDSDLENLRRLLQYTNVLPTGMYMDEVMSEARRELTQECDYVHEAANMMRYRELISDDADYVVPEALPELTTKRVLTSEYMPGVGVVAMQEEEQDVRDWFGDRVLGLCLRELFEFRFMQTDPNWSNFYLDAKHGRMVLLDFGACTDYDAAFTDNYLRVVVSAAKEDRDGCIHYSRKLGFLTGDEAEVMNDAHVQSLMALGRPFRSDGAFDFGAQTITKDIHELVPTMLKHRLTPPPQQSYSLHRKLAGAFLLCSKLQANVHCKHILDSAVQKYGLIV